MILTKELIIRFLVKITIEAFIRTVLMYLVLIIIPSIILLKPPVISPLFIYILIICIIASALYMYIISPILITLAYFLVFFNSVIRLGGGTLEYDFFIEVFKISFSLDLSLLIFVLFSVTVVPMSLSAFYSYYVTVTNTHVRKPPLPLTGATIRNILSEIFEI